MKKQIIFLLAIALFIFPQFSFAKSLIKQARDYVKIGKNYEAMEKINEAILDDPLNSDLHLEAGFLYLGLNRMKDFSLAMDNSCKLDSSNCSKVGELQLAGGFIFLDSHKNVNAATESFRKSFSNNPKNKQRIITRLLRSGESWVLGRNIQQAERYFRVLLNIDFKSKEKIAEIYFRNALNASSNNMINLFRKAVYYSKGYKAQIGNKLVEMAKDDRYSEKEKDAFKREAGKYLSENQFLVYFPPDYKIYQPRSEPYVFDLKAGETTDHWIMFPSGRNNNIDFKSENFKFVIEYYEGDKYNCWEISSLPHKTRLKFKLKSIDGQPIEMVAK